MRRDLPDGFLDRVIEFTNDFPKKVTEYETLLTKNRIWLERTKGVGVLSAEQATSYGLSGPILRACGVPFDLRKARPYAAYADMDFEIATGQNGDTYDRYTVRIKEMREANKIVKQAAEKMPDGDIKVKVSAAKPPKGMVYHGVEGPKGELGYLLVSDFTKHIYRMHVRPACFINLASLPELVKGHLLADVVTLIGTIDIVLGEVDR